MLYLLYRGNHPDLEYQGGQQPILHLQADLHKTIEWAEQNGVRWAFSDGNAGSFYAQYYKRKGDLDKLNWEAIKSTDFRDAAIKEGKQAEFLLLDRFPWSLVEKIGVANPIVLAKVREIVQNDIELLVEPTWYY
jgi:ssDNA thymidine ADP-ribosyltransferase, DarT